MSNMDNFLKLVSEEDTTTLSNIRERIKNRAMLRESQQIAMKVIFKLEALGWTQKDLAEAMKVTPQQITKIVSGKENLTIDTQIKLQNILGIPVLASYYENKITENAGRIVTMKKHVEKIVAQKNQITNNYQASKTMKMERHSNPPENYKLTI